MPNLIKKIQNTNSHYQLWQRNQKLVLAISGGPDSMVLLHIFHILSQKENLKLIVAHVNYQYRKESWQDEKIVSDFCKKNNIKLEILTNLKLSKKEHNESKWREIRFNFFEEIREENQANAIALAHNKNDQVETLLLHLIRGGGLNGLCAIRFKRNKIIRPLLNISRKEILIYLKKNKLEFAIDKSNFDKKYLRNKIRLNLIPYLERNYNIKIVDTLSQNAKNIADDYDFLTSQIEEFWNFNNEKKEITFSASDFLKKHLAEQRLVLRKMLEKILNNLKDISFNTLEEVRFLITSQKNKNQKMQFKNLKIVKKGDKISIVEYNKIKN